MTAALCLRTFAHGNGDAVAARYEVITTSSPRNFDYVKKLGASQVFDYRSKTAVKDIIKAFKGKTIAGALAGRS